MDTEKVLALIAHRRHLLLIRITTDYGCLWYSYAKDTPVEDAVMRACRHLHRPVQVRWQGFLDQETTSQDGSPTGECQGNAHT